MYCHGYITLLPFEIQTFVVYGNTFKIIYSNKTHMVINYKGVDFVIYYHEFPTMHTMVIRLVSHVNIFIKLTPLFNANPNTH